MNNPIAKIFGLRMKEARENIGFSQDELARKLGMTRLSIGNYESGSQCPGLDTAIEVALQLDLSLDAILREYQRNSLTKSLERVEDLDLRGILEKTLSVVKEAIEKDENGVSSSDHDKKQSD